MVRKMSARLSLVLGAWALLLLGLFVWSGDLRVGDPERASSRAVAAASSAAPVVVRRKELPDRDLATAARRGRVIDTRGFRVVGAEVVPAHGAPVRTGADGSFVVGLPSFECSDLLFRAEGMQPQWRRTSAHAPDDLIVQLVPGAPWDEPPQPPTAPLPLRGEGLVRTEQGQPVGGAFVNLVGTDVWACTDEFGRYVLPLPAITAELAAHVPAAARGSAGLFGRVFVAAERSHGIVPLPDAVVERAAAIRGVLRDPLGAPIEAAPVAIRGHGVARCIETAAGGRLHVSGLPAGDYRVEALGWRGAIGFAIAVRAGELPASCDLYLQSADDLPCRVVDQHGVAVARAFVATWSGGLRRAVAQADSDGLVSLWMPLGQEQKTEFEVRAPDSLQRLAVRSCFPIERVLVVARDG